MCCPTLHAYIWDGPSPNRDSGFDQEILIHELTHGLTNRIIGHSMAKGLDDLTGQPGGLGEGYSDFYALALLRGPNDDPDGTYVIGGYSALNLKVLGQPSGWKNNYYYGIRHFPYTTDLCKNPFTLRSMQTPNYTTSPPDGVSCTSMPVPSPWLRMISGGPHDMGEIWAAMLWEVRRNLVSRYRELGNELMLQLVTNSLFHLWRNPTFIEARDAILLADALIGGGNKCDIWRGFAKRGMGTNAATPRDGMFVEDFSIPGECDVSAPAALSNPGTK
jgi:hypothetical protein